MRASFEICVLGKGRTCDNVGVIRRLAQSKALRFIRVDHNIAELRSAPTSPFLLLGSARTEVALFLARAGRIARNRG